MYHHHLSPRESRSSHRAHDIAADAAPPSGRDLHCVEHARDTIARASRFGDRGLEAVLARTGRASPTLSSSGLVVRFAGVKLSSATSREPRGDIASTRGATGRAPPETASTSAVSPTTSRRSANTRDRAASRRRHAWRGCVDWRALSSLRALSSRRPNRSTRCPIHQLLRRRRGSARPVPRERRAGVGPRMMCAPSRSGLSDQRAVLFALLVAAASSRSRLNGWAPQLCEIRRCCLVALAATGSNPPSSDDVARHFINSKCRAGNSMIGASSTSSPHVPDAAFGSNRSLPEASTPGACGLQLGAGSGHPLSVGATAEVWSRASTGTAHIRRFYDRIASFARFITF